MNQRWIPAREANHEHSAPNLETTIHADPAKPCFNQGDWLPASSAPKHVLAVHQSNMAKGACIGSLPSTWRGLRRVLRLYYVSTRVDIRSQHQEAALRRTSCTRDAYLLVFCLLLLSIKVAIDSRPRRSSLFRDLLACFVKWLHHIFIHLRLDIEFESICRKPSLDERHSFSTYWSLDAY